MYREESADFVDGFNAVVALVVDRKPIDPAVLARMVGAVESGGANVSEGAAKTYAATLRRLAASTDIDDQVSLADDLIRTMGKASQDERGGRPPGEGLSLAAQCVLAVSFGFNAVMRVAMGRELPPTHMREVDDLEFALRAARAGLVNGYSVTDGDVEAVGRLKAAAEAGDAARVRQLAKELVAVFPSLPARSA